MKRRQQLTEGKTTLELSKFVPLDNIKFYWSLHTLMQNYHFYIRPDLIGEINRESKTHRKRSKRGLTLQDHEAAMKHFFESLPIEKLGEFVGKSYFKKRGRPKDIALNFLIAALLYDLRKYGQENSFSLNCSLIADFLNGQSENKDSAIGAETIEKKCRRIDFNEISKDLFHFLVSASDRPFLDAIEASNVSGIHSGFFTVFLKSLRDGFSDEPDMITRHKSSK